jgi:hypothetical protein
MKKETPVLGWHFLPQDGRLQFGVRRAVKVGKTYRATGELVLCQNGMHASEKIIDALRYAPGPICCRVELAGSIISDTDKLVARSRRVLAMIDSTRILHEFACICAEDALKLIHPPPPRSFAAGAAKRKWLAGEISDAEFAAARAAALAAVPAAARDAQNERLTAMVLAEMNKEGRGDVK